MEELKFKGTPGPWYTTPHNHIKAENHEPIAHVFGYETYNARLIAAAPDMLEALQDLVNTWMNPDKPIGEMCYYIENAHRIIKKALEE